MKNLTTANRKPKVFYTVPNFQNPTGITTSLQRRLEILDIASRYNLIIIEDDPYGELSYEGKAPAGYTTLDNEERVVYLGSYSKVLIPGIRIGWMAGPTPLIEKAGMAKQTADLCSSSLGQQLAFRLTREGYIDAHIRRLKIQYRKKRDAMIKAMDKFFPADVTFTRPGGGFFSWIDFPSYYPTASELLDICLEQGVAFVHGEGFFTGGGGNHSARFSFSQPALRDIIHGIEKVGTILREVGPKHSSRAVRH